MITIQPFQRKTLEENYEKLVELIADEDTKKYYFLEQGQNRPAEDLLDYMYWGHTQGYLHYTIHKNDEVVGIMNACGPSSKVQKQWQDIGEIGYAIHPDYRGQGIAQQALQRYQEEHPEEPLIALPMAEHKPSRKILENQGFNCVGLQVIHHSDGKYFAAIYTWTPKHPNTK